MQRLPLAERRVTGELDDRPLARFCGLRREQPVAAAEILFLRVADDVQRDTLPGPRLFNRLILRM